jgi:hypothetical protein
VDTYFHASCVLGENMTKQSNLPSMREVLILEGSVNSILYVSYTILLISWMDGIIGASLGPDPLLRDQ